MADCFENLIVQKLSLLVELNDPINPDLYQKFDVKRGDELVEGFATHILGRGNILNILGALAIAERLGVSVESQRRAVRQIEQIEHRLSMRRNGGIVILDDAYNSNPTGARMALEVLSGFVTTGKRYVVTPGFVEMGSKQYDNNKLFGEDIAIARPDRVFVDNEVNRKAIVLKDVKEVGSYVALVKLHKDVTAKVKVNIKTKE